MEHGFYYLWLSNIEGINLKTAYSLIARFKGAENVFEASFGDIISKGFSGAVAKLITNARNKNVDRTNALIEELVNKKIGYLSINDDNYPEDLRNIYTPPIILYIRGEMPDEDLLRISVVGTRRCSEYGANMAYSFSKELARSGAVIVSGMAAGIDSIAHRGAIAGGGKTVAVFGCGADVCYPADNRRLMEEILENGCIVTEYPPGTRPLQGNFPARNRIISGLSKAVFVVEAGAKSGTLITVDYALEQGKDVFALPGNITSGCSSGTNTLIRQGASLVSSPADILEELRYIEQYGVKSAPQAEGYSENELNALDDDEKVVYSYIGREPAQIESLAERTGYSAPTLTYILTCIEIKGLIKKLPGGRYIRSL